jgi:hypothetical protein
MPARHCVESAASPCRRGLSANAEPEYITGLMKSGDRVGPYLVTSKLGEGGMGEVYRASDSRLKREVALKVLPANVASDPDRLARFQREAEVLASLNHPNIAQVHGLEISGGITALVLELIEGDDLSQSLTMRGAIPVAEALRIAEQIAAALEAAHDRGIVHRDLKPANIKVRPDGYGQGPRLRPRQIAGTEHGGHGHCDFIRGPRHRDARVHEPGAGARRRPQAVKRTSGRSAWCSMKCSPAVALPRPSSADTLVQVLTASVDESKLPAGVPGPVRRLIRRCLSRRVKRRWRSIGDARIEIEDALSNPADATGTSGGSLASPASVSRRRALASGIGVLGALAAGVGGGVWLDRQLRPGVVPAYRRLTFRTRRGSLCAGRTGWADDSLWCAMGEQPLPRSHRSLGWPGIATRSSCRMRTSSPFPGPEMSPWRLAATRKASLRTACSRGAIGRGAPREIVDGVKFADWSPMARRLAIVRRGELGDHLEFPVGRVLVAPVPGGTSGLGFPRVSPDGTRVAFAVIALRSCWRVAWRSSTGPARLPCSLPST